MARYILFIRQNIYPHAGSLLTGGWSVVGSDYSKEHEWERGVFKTAVEEIARSVEFDAQPSSRARLMAIDFNAYRPRWEHPD